ncbi:MAG: hypothetical protein MSG64_15710 [Pyrinomonadaceae bacterium MAG19_C2-C3]|nr:hypothetical protein [Pyrinomonadaceae bacterium MAG19_C2-C3]
MSLQTKLQDLLTRTGTEFKSLRAAIGALSGLTTTDKSSLVAAVNEVKAGIGTGGSGSTIDDANTATTTTYSSSKITAVVANVKAEVKTEILGGASAAYDTLAEIQALMDADNTETSSILTALGNRVRADAAQGLTAAQQLQARANIAAVATDDVGNTDTNLVALFEAALI